MSKKQFKKLPADILQEHPQQVFQRTANHVGEYVEAPASDPNLRKLKGLPKEWQTVYWLWRFQCEAGISSIEVVCLDPLGIYLPQIHAALQEIGASNLVEGLEAGIAIAREGRADFTTLSDQSWFDQFSRVEKFPTLHSIDRELRPAVNSLTARVLSFVRENSAVFFDEQN